MIQAFLLSSFAIWNNPIPTTGRGMISTIMHSIPVSMLIQDNLKGKKISGKVQYEQTQITIRNVEFAKVPDTVYTKPYLEMMSAR